MKNVDLRYPSLKDKTRFERENLSRTLISIDKWGPQLKTTKQKIQDFMILEL